MEYRTLGQTGIEVSAIALGAGPVPDLMTSRDSQRQLETLRCALDAGVNWIDTAATYGGGWSETNLGQALRDLDGVDAVHLATKVRLAMQDEGTIEARVRQSVTGSLQRLSVDRLALLQLHNSITVCRGDEPTSVSVEDVLGPGGVLEVFEQLQHEGVVDHLGLTGIGQPEALREVIRTGKWATIQVPYNVLNQSAGRDVLSDFTEANYGNVIADCAEQQMGVMAIRVYAGGALANQLPSRHTRQTRFFPLDLYERDQHRVERLASRLQGDLDIKEVALRYVLGHPKISSAIIGFSEPGHVQDAVEYLAAGPLASAVIEKLQNVEVQ
ncbi:MAG: aldo/keto reductase [Pirellulaceae bacterium]